MPVAGPSRGRRLWLWGQAGTLQHLLRKATSVPPSQPKPGLATPHSFPPMPRGYRGAEGSVPGHCGTFLAARGIPQPGLWGFRVPHTICGCPGSGRALVPLPGPVRAGLGWVLPRSGPGPDRGSGGAGGSQRWPLSEPRAGSQGGPAMGAQHLWRELTWCLRGGAGDIHGWCWG